MYHEQDLFPKTFVRCKDGIRNWQIMNRHSSLLQQRRQSRQREMNWYSLRLFQDRHDSLLSIPSGKFLEEQEQHRQARLAKGESTD